jgi:ABC-2 type transport system ATP-binding protein
MIRIANVYKSFGPTPALDGVTLSISPGERIAFVGANGSGKTTLLRALLGLVRVKGTVTIAGTDVAREPDVALRSIAYMPQIAPPLEAPVREVVRAFCRLRARSEKDVEIRAIALGVSALAVADVRFRDLSGGMKQKLLAAMALAAEAPILVCDEPTANLDPAARVAFFREVDLRPRTGTLVLCSHRVEEVRHLVDRVVEMRDGRVIRDGTLDELFADVPAYRVEVTLRPGHETATAFLRGRGFVPSLAGRLGARLTKQDKLDVVTRLLRDHDGAVADLAVYDVEELPLHGATPRRPAQEMVS